MLGCPGALDPPAQLVPSLSSARESKDERAGERGGGEGGLWVNFFVGVVGCGLVNRNFGRGEGVTLAHALKIRYPLCLC
jgi:hypothetical protein